MGVCVNDLSEFVEWCVVVVVVARVFATVEEFVDGE